MIRRIILLPIYILLLLMNAAVNLLLRLSAWIFYAIAGLLLLTTICCYYMQIESSEGLRRMLIGCGTLFIIPQSVTMLSAVLEVATEIIGNKIRTV